ncbi:MAG: hypothetical protein HYV09_11100 [Deltaproteobacteria bacterium]|nr:hypothetical protein [Deltaproteobacteria bacterium]
MDVGKVASLYIHGSEQAVAGNEMLMTAVLRRPYDPAALRRAYRRFVEENPTIASKLVENPARQAFTWLPFSDEERASRVEREERELAFVHDPRDAHDAYYPTNERLPFRIVPVGASTLLFCVNHAFSNGKGLLAWVSRWFETYAEELGEPVPARKAWPAVTLPPGGLRGFFAAVAGLFWTIVYLVGFIARAGKRAAVDTVDLGDLGDRKGEPLCRQGFVVKTYRFTTDDTARVVAAAKARGLTVGQHLGAALSELFFDAQPDRGRVCMSMPLDLRGELPHLSLQALGNYTGSLVVQVHRGGDAASQLRAAYRWLARRIPYWLTWMVGGTTESKLFRRFAEQARRPNAARAPLENFTFALSNIGRIDDPVLAHFLEDISGHTRTQTIFLAVSTFNRRLAIEVSFARDLYPEGAVLAVLDRLPARALKAPSAVGAGAADESLAAA